MFGTTQSGKIYKSSEELENSPLISPSRESEEDFAKVSSRNAVSLIRQRIPRLPPPPTPPPASPPSPPSPSTPAPQCSMASMIKLPVFRGVGNEYLDHFWFVVRPLWEAQGFMDENIEKATLVSALQGHALTWYIKHPNDHLNAGIAKIQNALNREFSRPNS